MYRATCCLAGLLALSACGGDDGVWQFEAAEAVRELEMFEEVPIVRMTREEFAAQAAAEADEIDPDTLQYYADTYGRLGFFDRDLDLRPVFAGSSSDWVGATYSPGRKLITLVGEARDDVLVHEAVHAIQDQHFDIAAYDDTSSSDGFLARRATVEGDATLAQYRFFGEYMQSPGFTLDGWDWAQVFEQRRVYADDILVEAGYPAVFLDYVSFVYSRGLEYCVANLTGATWDAPIAAPAPHDWGLQDLLYTQRPPATTRQVLALDVDGAEPPAEVGLADVPAELAARLEMVDWDRLGHWYVYLLLHPLRLEVDAEGLAATWQADRALFLRDLETGATATLWTSDWATEADADAMAAAMWQLFGQNPIKGDPAFRALTDDGELAHIERRGNRLVVARNLDAALLGTLVEACFVDGQPAAARRLPSLPAFIEKHSRRL